MTSVPGWPGHSSPRQMKRPVSRTSSCWRNSGARRRRARRRDARCAIRCHRPARLRLVREQGARPHVVRPLREVRLVEHARELDRILDLQREAIGRHFRMRRYADQRAAGAHRGRGRAGPGAAQHVAQQRAPVADRAQGGGWRAVPAECRRCGMPRGATRSRAGARASPGAAPRADEARVPACRRAPGAASPRRVDALRVVRTLVGPDCADGSLRCGGARSPCGASVREAARARAHARTARRAPRRRRAQARDRDVVADQRAQQRAEALGVDHGRALVRGPASAGPGPATPACSDRPVEPRLQQFAQRGIVAQHAAQQLHAPRDPRASSTRSGIAEALDALHPRRCIRARPRRTRASRRRARRRACGRVATAIAS